MSVLWFQYCVYAEIDIDDNELERLFSHKYAQYRPPFGDDQDVNDYKQSYNPYWFMKYPWIPLHVCIVDTFAVKRALAPLHCCDGIDPLTLMRSVADDVVCYVVQSHVALAIGHISHE